MVVGTLKNKKWVQTITPCSTRPTPPCPPFPKTFITDLQRNSKPCKIFNLRWKSQTLSEILTWTWLLKFRIRNISTPLLLNRASIDSLLPVGWGGHFKKARRILKPIPQFILAFLEMTPHKFYRLWKWSPFLFIFVRHINIKIKLNQTQFSHLKPQHAKTSMKYLTNGFRNSNPAFSVLFQFYWSWLKVKKHKTLNTMSKL